MTARARPEYPKRHAGPVLVAGSAPCLFDDVLRARLLHDDAPIMALNEAAAAMEHIDHLVVGHYYKAPQFMALREERWPGRPAYTGHACDEPGRIQVPCIDHWWTDAKGQATVAWVAVRIARAMGFEEIILCGCPLDTSGYWNDGQTHLEDEGTPRVGHDNSHPTTRRYRERFEHYARTEPGAPVRSMSGWTRDLLGAP